MPINKELTVLVKRSNAAEFFFRSSPSGYRTSGSGCRTATVDVTLGAFDLLLPKWFKFNSTS